MLKLTGLSVLAGVLMVAAQPASARFFDPTLKAVESIAEPVRCRTIRERVVRPGGRVIYRTRRVCRPGIGPGRYVERGCRTVRERIVRPNGSVVYRSVRRC